MKKRYPLLFGLLLFVCYTSTAIGQEADFPVTKIQESIGKALTLLRQTPYRKIATFEKYDPETGKLIRTSKGLNEIMSPARRRMVLGPVSGETEIYESRNINGTMYQRRNDLAWQVFIPPAVIAENPAVKVAKNEPPPVSKLRRSGKRIVSETLGKERVTIYEINTTVDNDASDEDIQRIGNRRYWIRNDGLFAKVVNESRTQDGKLLSRTTELYEYENIQIDEPLLAYPKTNEK